jgi:hypothetical protein
VSLEAMASGTVAVSNFSDTVLAAHPDLPVVRIDPDTVADRLARLLRDPDERRRLAVAGRAFVERAHSADVGAAVLVEHYRAPRRPVPDRAMPDWISLARARRIESLETRLGKLEQDLARARLREDALCAQLAGTGDSSTSIARRTARRVVPHRVRRWFVRRGVRSRA